MSGATAAPAHVMSLPKLEGPSLMADQVFDVLRTAILNGELPAGHRLRIRDIAAQVGTSVMPVREAIGRLEAAGLAEREPHKGAVVTGLTLTDLAHTYDVRLLLEVQAARLGADHIEPSEVEQMQREYDRMRSAVAQRRAVDVIDFDEALLSVLYAASGNPVLLATVRSLWSRCRSYKILGAEATMRSSDDSPLWSFQEALVEAARGQRAAEAADITRTSLLNASDRIRAQLEAEGHAGSDADLSAQATR